LALAQVAPSVADIFVDELKVCRNECSLNLLERGWPRIDLPQHS